MTVTDFTSFIDYCAQYKKNLNRMKSITFLSIPIILLTISCAKPNKDNLIDESGSNLQNWEIALGDGIYNTAGEVPVTINDIITNNYNGYSELKANTANRRIQAHNITFKRIIDVNALNCRHEAGFSFKLPYLPSTINSEFNGQTLEGGLFVWDGANAKKDFGLAFQWIINPWNTDFKDVKIWSGTGWDKIGTLTPDTLYHSVKFNLDIKNQIASFTIDDFQYKKNCFSETTKTGWGSEIAARLQTEIISIYPSITGFTPSHKAYFKDWYWKWIVY
jgi:hypothetical protein